MSEHIQGQKYVKSDRDFVIGEMDIWKLQKERRGRINKRWSISVLKTEEIKMEYTSKLRRTITVGEEKLRNAK